MCSERSCYRWRLIGSRIMTHDYKRNGTTTLFAALDVLTGSVIGQCLSRHRHVEFLAAAVSPSTQSPTKTETHH